MNFDRRVDDGLVSRTKRPVCARKQEYRSEDQAKYAITRIRQKGGPRMRAYRCPLCGRYHLTSQDSD